jgi:hypothetical protein
MSLGGGGGTAVALRRPGQGGGSACLGVLFAAAIELCPRDDGHPDRRVVETVTADRLRTG